MYQWKGGGAISPQKLATVIAVSVGVYLLLHLVTRPKTMHTSKFYGRLYGAFN